MFSNTSFRFGFNKSTTSKLYNLQKQESRQMNSRSQLDISHKLNLSTSKFIPSSFPSTYQKYSTKKFKNIYSHLGSYYNENNILQDKCPSTWYSEAFFNTHISENVFLNPSIVSTPWIYNSQFYSSRNSKSKNGSNKFGESVEKWDTNIENNNNKSFFQTKPQHKNSFKHSSILSSSNIKLNDRSFISFNSKDKLLSKNQSRSYSTQSQMSNSTPGNNLIFNFTPETLKEFSEKLIVDATKFYDSIASEKNASFDTIVKKIAVFEGALETNISSISFPKDIHPDEAMRDVSTEHTNKINSFIIESYARKDLYEQVKKVKDSEEYISLSRLDKLLVDRMIRDFERNGLALDESSQNRVKEIKKREAELAVTFQRNLAEDKSRHLFTEEELEGCPQAYIEGLKKDEETGKRIVTLQYPDIIPLFQNAKRPETRKIMDALKSKQCEKENAPIFEEILELRRELASLLGFKNYADYALDVAMAKNSENVKKFLFDLKDGLFESGKKELQELLKYKEKDGYTDEFQSYDWNYYFRLRKETEYSLDNQKIKEYFPTSKVISGSFEMYERLFSIKFVEQPDQTVWGYLKLYNVYDANDTNQLLGQLYLDLHPREGKYGHAACFPLQPACITEDGSRQHGIAAMVCNFPKELKDDNGKTVPSTLPFDDVVTYLHELGHCLHSILSKTTYSKFSGTNVSRDFVECPSQMLENWAYNSESLKLLASHVETGESLPEDLIKRIIAAKNCNIALFNLRQLFFGIVDITVHTATEYIDTKKIWNELRPQIQLVKNPENANGFAGFAHLVGGYAAGYYGYLYSLAFAQDLHSRFESEGILNPKVGADYRRAVLEQGDEVDNMEIMTQFLGREPNNKAFLKSMSIESD